MIETLAMAAWRVLNHDNDPFSGKPDDSFNWRMVRHRMKESLLEFRRKAKLKGQASLKGEK